MSVLQVVSVIASQVSVYVEALLARRKCLRRRNPARAVAAVAEVAPVLMELEVLAVQALASWGVAKMATMVMMQPPEVLLLQVELLVVVTVEPEEMKMVVEILLPGVLKRRPVEVVVLPCIPVVILLMAVGMEPLVRVNVKENGLERVVKRSIALTMTKPVASQIVQRMECVSRASAFVPVVGAWRQAKLE